MTQIRIAALADLNGQIPTAHYFGRPHSIDADLELTRVLLGSPEGLTLREHRAAQALQDWAFCEKRFRTISDTAFPARDCDDPTPAPGMTPDQERELIGRREVHRRSALEYARMLDDAQLIEHYRTPLPAPAPDTATPAPVVTADDATPYPAIKKEGYLLKRAALVKKYQATWPDIATDLNHASENGLSAAAKGTKHGDWFESAVLAWGDQRGKRDLQQITRAANSMFNLPGTKYTKD